MGFPCAFSLQFFGQANFQKIRDFLTSSRCLCDDRQVNLVATPTHTGSFSSIYTFTFWADPSKSETLKMKHLGKKGLQSLRFSYRTSIFSASFHWGKSIGLICRAEDIINCSLRWNTSKKSSKAENLQHSKNLKLLNFPSLLLSSESKVKSDLKKMSIHKLWFLTSLS